MPITVPDLEDALVNRARDLLTFLGMSTATDGANADLKGPVAFGCRHAGLSLANPMAATDDDLTRLDLADLDKLLDLAELRLLLSMETRFTEADAYVGSSRVDYSSVGQGLAKRVDKQMKLCEKQYGYSRSVLTAGLITLPIGTVRDGCGGF